MRLLQPLLSMRGSLPAKLALAAAVFVIAVTAVRSLSIDRLAQVDAVSAEVRNRWLDSVRVLGTVSHHVALVRTEEAEVLLGGNVPAIATNSGELQRNLDLAAHEIDRYRAVKHDADETILAGAFLKDWAEHNQHARALEALAQSGQTAEATALFEGAAQDSFHRTTASLRRLVDLTETKADAARKAAAEAIAQAQRFVSDLIFAVLVLFIALAAYVWRSFSYPLLDLSKRMRRLASHDTSFSVPFEGRQDEIGMMARALAVFRRNTFELLESRKSLALQAEILSGSLEKERALATEQKNFITTMSHEFRTPLTGIDGNAQRLIATKDRTSPAEIADRAQRIRAAVFRLTSLVASLTGAMERANDSARPQIRHFDLSTTLNDVARYYREIAFGDTLEVRLGPLPDAVSGDPELLYYALSNLISNAFKYSPDGGIVTLSAEAKDGFIEVTVEDHGVGIPPDEIHRVRERYFRGSNVGSIPGGGIGLNLVDQIVRQHGGRVQIDSDVGAGTRVTVFLPSERADPSPLESTREQDFMRRGR